MQLKEIPYSKCSIRAICSQGSCSCDYALTLEIIKQSFARMERRSNVRGSTVGDPKILEISMLSGGDQYAYIERNAK